MSVLMTMWIKGDPRKVEEIASQNAERMDSILDRAKEQGLIAHRFFGNEDGGQVLVVDEWPDRESFERFFAAAQGDIQPLFQEAGIESEPGINFWRVLDTPDKFGWDA